jgi:transcriptional regulator with XRE-family HTH domain
MGMSDTIQSRSYSARQASLLQQPPSALIDAVESNIRESVFHRLPMKFCVGGQASTYIIGAGAAGLAISKAITGSGQVVAVVDTDWSTSGGEVAVEDNDHESDSWQRWAETTKAVLTQSAQDRKTAPSAAARLRVERLAALQASFGLPMADLAQVLGITRQGLYKWLDASKDVKVQGANLERLALVERIGKKWRELSLAPLSSMAREPLANGKTVLDLLIDEEIDEAAAIGAVDQLAAKLQAKPKSRSQKLANAGFKRRPSARSLPADE